MCSGRTRASASMAALCLARPASATTYASIQRPASMLRSRRRLRTATHDVEDEADLALGLFVQPGLVRLPGKSASISRSESAASRWRPQVAAAGPDLLRDVRHVRVEQAQARVEDVDEHGQRRCLVAGAQADLGDLEVPVAELVPEELLDLAAGLAQLEALHEPVDVAGQALEAREDPAVLGGHRGAARRRRAPATRSAGLEVAEDEAGGVPELVGEVARRFHARLLRGAGRCRYRRR